MLRLRPAQLADAAVLSALAFRSKAHWGYDDAFMAACRDELTISHDRITNDFVVVAQIGDDVAALGCLSQKGQDGEIEDVFVAPECMGQGVGRALMAALIDRARTLGLRRLALDADPHAEAFYARMGFVTVGKSPSGSIPGRFLPRMAMDLPAGETV